MEFESLKKAELEAAGDAFAVDWTKSNPTKSDMIKDLYEEGVTWKMYKAAFPDPEEEVEDEQFDTEEEDEKFDDSDAADKQFTEKSRGAQQVLVKMTRANPSYEVRGYTFTKKHPFLPVSADDADFLVSSLGGFAIATPKEVEEFYS